MFLTGAVFTDLFKDKIYNAWVVPGLLVGMGTSLFQGQDRFIESILAVGAALLILLPVYFFKGIAAGDVKLFMSAGVISIAVIILKRNKQKTIHFAVPVLASVLFVVAGGLL